MLDLDIDREQRMQALAAERNAAVADTFPLKFRGRIVCELPSELPLDVLEPLSHVAVDLGLIVRTALDAARAQDPTAATMGVIDMVLDQLVTGAELVAVAMAHVAGDPDPAPGRVAAGGVG